MDLLLLEDFSKSVIPFLEKYAWVFNFKTTEILNHDIPKEFHFQDVNGNTNGTNWEQFTSTCDALTKLGESLFQVFENELDISAQHPLERPKKWTHKKFLEVLYFEQFLLTMFKDKDLCILDIGSGLGYLSLKLSRSFKKVLALEEKSSNVRTSETLNNSDNLSYVNVRLTKENMQSEIDNLLENKNNGNSGALIGLHSCGDLTPNTIKTFINSPNIKYMALASCCYHKMKCKDNFPLSQNFQKITFDIYFLRLASQRQENSFLVMNSQIEIEVNRVLFRAILEVFYKKYGTNRDLKFRSPKNCDDFQSYVNDLIENGSCEESDMENLVLLHQEHSSKRLMIQKILKLQAKMQRLCELVISLDRLSFMLENNVECALFTRVIPQSVTPRGDVLFASRR